MSLYILTGGITSHTPITPQKRFTEVGTPTPLFLTSGRRLTVSLVPVTIGLIFRLLGLGLMFSYYLYLVVLRFRNKTELYNYTIRGLFPVSEQRVLHGGKRSV